MKGYLSLILSLLTIGSLAAEEKKDAPPTTNDAQPPDATATATDDAAVDAETAEAQAKEDELMENLTAAAEQAEKDEALEEIRVAAEREKAEGETMDELKTIEGRVFEKVVINGVDDLGIRIRHQNGTARVKFDEVSKELQKRFGYDPELASEQARLEAKRAAAFTRAAIASLRAAKAQDKPGSPRSSSTASKPRTGSSDTPVVSSADIRTLESKIAVIQKGIAKLQNVALDYEEKAANIDSRNVRQLQEGVIEDREGARKAPKTAADKWRDKAYAEYEKIEAARALITKYRAEIRSLKRAAKRK